MKYRNNCPILKQSYGGLPRDYKIPTVNTEEDDFFSYEIPEGYEIEEKYLSDSKKKCEHKWKTTRLVFSTVTYCEKCEERKKDE